MANLFFALLLLLAHSTTAQQRMAAWNPDIVPQLPFQSRPPLCRRGVTPLHELPARPSDEEIDETLQCIAELRNWVQTMHRRSTIESWEQHVAEKRQKAKRVE